MQSEINWENCCRGRRNCPRVAVSDKFVLVKDDYGGQIKLPVEDARALIEKLNARLKELR